MKIRGIRIELGEVEAKVQEAVSSFGVREVVALMVPGSFGEDLAVVCAPDAADLTAIQDACRAHIPSHLRPSAFVATPELPRLANQKVDMQGIRRIAAAAGGRVEIRDSLGLLRFVAAEEAQLREMVMAVSVLLIMWTTAMHYLHFTGFSQDLVRPGREGASIDK